MPTLDCEGQIVQTDDDGYLLDGVKLEQRRSDARRARRSSRIFVTMMDQTKIEPTNRIKTMTFPDRLDCEKAKFAELNFIT